MSMLKKAIIIILAFVAILLFPSLMSSKDIGHDHNKVEWQVMKTESEWKEILSPEEYNILREKGTERAFTGEYNDHKEHGIYKCRGCGQDLFHSDHKYDSGSGWPSYYKPISDSAVVEKEDNSLWNFFVNKLKL